jgi:hypothetical protein
MLLLGCAEPALRITSPVCRCAVRGMLTLMAPALPLLKFCCPPLSAWTPSAVAPAPSSGTQAGQGAGRWLRGHVGYDAARGPRGEAPPGLWLAR